MKEFFIPTEKNNYTPYLLRKIFLASYTIILILVNTFGGVLGITQISASNITPQSIISLTNQERSIAGLNTLNSNQRLAAAAKAKAENMFEEQYWDHFGPNGETPWQFITAAGYNYVYAGENLAKGFRTSEGVVEAWMASKTHRDNILSKNYKDIGVAVMTGELLGKQTTLVVQMFGNLTTDIYTPEPPPTTQNETKTTTPSVPRQPTVIDRGQISAISITYPRQGAILRDPTIRIEGDAQGNKDNYTVEIYSLDDKMGEVEADKLEWKYETEDLWEDGEYNVEARVKGTNVKSEIVEFVVDTTPPRVIRESIMVQKSDFGFILSFDTDRQWHEIRVLNGDEEKVFLGAETSNNYLTLAEFSPSESIVIQISDEVGNVSEIDITEYFLEGEEEEYSTFGITSLLNSLRTTDGVNFVLISFILFLIFLQVIILWRKGKLNRSIGDIFVLGLWIVILTIGIFKGFGGVSI